MLFNREINSLNAIGKDLFPKQYLNVYGNILAI